MFSLKLCPFAQGNAHGFWHNFTLQHVMVLTVISEFGHRFYPLRESTG